MVLDEEESNRHRGRVWTTITLLFLLTLLFIVFRREIIPLLRIIGAALGIPFVSLPSTFDMSRALGVTFFNCFVGFFPIFFLWLFLFSRNSILPVFRENRDAPGQVALQDQGRQVRERFRATWQLLLFTLGLHGPAVSVKNGEIIATARDLERHGPGIVVVDFNSAIALEEQVTPPGLARVFEELLNRLLISIGLMDPYTSPRTCGPGLVFTRPRERIRGVVDLRRQFRIERDVRGYTRDGIEVSTKVNAIFSVGQEPDIVTVTMIGGRRMENLHVLILTENTSGHITIQQITDDLTLADRSQIFNDLQGLFAQPMAPYQAVQTPPSIPVFSPLRVFSQLPTFNSNRVFNAIYSEARDADENLSPWDQLPVQVAKGYFPEFISRYNFDELYAQENPRVFPLQNAQTRFQIDMRNTGILSYRFVAHVTGEDLRIGVRYPTLALRQYAPSPLTSPAVLRNRGIKIIASRFGDLTPVSDVVYQQRLDNWRAPWQRDTDISLADGELDAMRIRSRSRAQTQRDMAETLRAILEARPEALEANAVRVYQALEMAAANPTTRRLLPAETITLLRNLQLILLPDIPREGPR